MSDNVLIGSVQIHSIHSKIRPKNVLTLKPNHTENIVTVTSSTHYVENGNQIPAEK